LFVTGAVPFDKKREKVEEQAAARKFTEQASGILQGEGQGILGTFEPKGVLFLAQRPAAGNRL
jgi:hypothetical protein